MPLKQAEAIILRTFNIGEQDKLVVFMGRHIGLNKGVAKGARKFGNRFGSSLEPLSYVKVFYYEKEGRELVTISNCDLIESFFEVHHDIHISFTLSYFSELIESSYPSRTDDDILFRLLLLILQQFKAGGKQEELTAYFEIWFLKINGFLPDFKYCKKCRRELRSEGWLSPKKDGVYCLDCAPNKKIKLSSDIQGLLSWVKKNPPPQGKNFPFTSEQIQSAHRVLKEIIVFHLEQTPKSLNFLDK